MSTPAQGTAFSLAVGGSRLGDIPLELRRALVFPGATPRIKEEDQALVWRLQLVLPGLVEAGVVKLYRRRGMWNRLRGGVLRFRVQREFSALCALADGGVSCSQPLVWGWGFAPTHGHFELLVTREIPGVVSLKEYLAASGGRLRAEDLLPLFDNLCRMHERGVYHGALWPKNILLAKATGGAREFHLIDLARSVRFPENIFGTSMARFDLLSLLYSLVQTDAAFDSEAVLRRYGCGPAEARKIATQALGYRSSRHLRNRLALTFQMRALWAHCRSGGPRGIRQS
ncbi:MAG TPA: lipopolysaccharide kinase InaA family protein [Candidatus Paceibacterota bacterium]|nr:lipopolysaccharide kinase InaA family protein [Verrucomicrobiota bacterium]HSA09931.1 lipopolysaccharide kinase InaA family protein [Candidatus Paceibacterota bacterium]